MVAAMVKILFGQNQQNRKCEVVTSAENLKLEAFPVEIFPRLRYIGCHKALETIPILEKIAYRKRPKAHIQNF